MSSAALATTQIATLADKLAQARKFQRDERGLIGRDTELLIAQAALVARVHVLLYGVPGVAKSMTVDAVLSHLPELSLFKTQAYKASPPEQFLGPISIKRMEHDEFVRIVLNKLADVEVGFIDEVPRAPRAVLPAFQGMMVEREFDSGNGVQPVPLMTLFGTGNDIQPDPELNAFFDRWTLKLIVSPPASQEQFKEIMRGARDRRKNGVTPVPDSLIVTKDELLQLQYAATQVHVPEAIDDAMAELWSNLLGIGITPSIRRNVDFEGVMQALAVLDGRDELLIDDLQAAAHSFWTQPEEAPAVRKEVNQFASEWVKEKNELIDSFQEVLDRLGQVQSLVAARTPFNTQVEIGEKETSITQHAIQIVHEQRELRDLIERHKRDAQGRDVTDLEAIETQMDAAKEWIQDRVMGGLSI